MASGRPTVAPRTIAFRRSVDRLNKKIEQHSPPGLRPYRWNNSDAKEVYIRYSGRCCFCGVGLTAHTAGGMDSLYLDFYIPIERGGRHNDLENVVPVCSDHYRGSLVRRDVRKDIPDINTFADLLEQFVRCIFSVEKMREDKNPELSLILDKKDRLKRILNLKLEDIATALQYNPFRDWIPENYEFVIENSNTLPDLIEKTAEAVLDEDTEGVVQSKKETVERIKQILHTKQYKIVREDAK